MVRERLAEGEELGSDRLRVAHSSLWFREATRAQDLLGRALDPPVRPRNGCNGPNRRCRAAAGTNLHPGQNRLSPLIDRIGAPARNTAGPVGWLATANAH
jgi:hypothetical protein